MTAYFLAKRLSDGLALIQRSDHRGTETALWDLTRCRKPHTCAMTRSPIAVGDFAWRPIGNSMYRYERLSRLPSP